MRKHADTPQEPSMQEIMRLAQTPEGQQIIAMLRSQGGDQLRQVMAQAAQGDYTQAKEAISSLIATPEMQKLLSQLGGK